MLSRATTPRTAFALIMLAPVIVSGYTSVNAVVKAEPFPAEILALGCRIPSSFLYSAAPLIALCFKGIVHKAWYYMGT